MNSLSYLVSERVKELRKLRGLSQEQLALKANLNTSFVGMIERGKKKPTIDTIEKIVTALDVSIEDFFNFDFNKSNNVESEVLDKLCFLLKDKSLDEQESIYTIVKQIINLNEQK